MGKCKKNDNNNHNTRMQQTSAKRVQVQTRQGGEGDPLGIVQETEI